MSVYLYGSVPMKDYKHGWSDIDIVCFTHSNFSHEQAEKLKMLRQHLRDTEKHNKFFRKFEGVILPFNVFLTQNNSQIVYWGTSGQKIVENYKIDPFSMFELINHSKLLYGEDIRNQLTPPTKQDFINAIMHHYNSIRTHAKTTDSSLYSCGWLLDIARCLYTLKTNKVISKTKAGKWALKNHLCPEPNQMKRTLKVRNNPLKYKDNEKIKEWLSSLGPSVQSFANELEKELNKKQ